VKLSVSNGTKIGNSGNPLGHEQGKPSLGHCDALKNKKETTTLPIPKQNLFVNPVEERKNEALPQNEALQMVEVLNIRVWQPSVFFNEGLVAQAALGLSMLSESDRDTGMCDCSSLKNIMQTLDLIQFFQCVIYTLRGIWGFMYGHVCETGGTTEVLPSRPLTYNI